jgi:class 3 adenylate cyclase/rhodanese-related sulfurtransferase
MTFQRITAADLQACLAAPPLPLLLDVRRREAFRKLPEGIPGAIPVLLDDRHPRIPEVSSNRPIVTYCLCESEASSSRVALWLSQAGFRNVSVLVGGLGAWMESGQPLAKVGEIEPGPDWHCLIPEAHTPAASEVVAEGLVPLMAEQTFLAGVQLPVRREMAVLFVDMVDSTRLLFRHPPEQVLAIIQAFMEIVVDIAVHHCGDVKDFEGDGAMLFFAGPGEAVPAAFELRATLDARRRELPELPQARFALDQGPLVIGPVGTRFRRALSFVGPSVNIAARILKLGPPGSIIATERVIGHSRELDPDLAARFDALPEKQTLKGIESGPVTVYVAVNGSVATSKPEVPQPNAPIR